MTTQVLITTININDQNERVFTGAFTAGSILVHAEGNYLDYLRAGTLQQITPTFAGNTVINRFIHNFNQIQQFRLQPAINSVIRHTPYGKIGYRPYEYTLRLWYDSTPVLSTSKTFEKSFNDLDLQGSSLRIDHRLLTIIVNVEYVAPNQVVYDVNNRVIIESVNTLFVDLNGLVPLGTNANGFNSGIIRIEG